MAINRLAVRAMDVCDTRSCFALPQPCKREGDVLPSGLRLPVVLALEWRGNVSIHALAYHKYWDWAMTDELLRNASEHYA